MTVPSFLYNHYMLENVKIVLVNTTHPGNIGATARAMKTMGLERLVLVSPKLFPSAECTARAAGADDILARARVFSSLADAVADCGLVFGTSARERSIAWPEVSPETAARQIISRSKANPETAVVFGRESSGLSNEELEICHAMLRIPTNAEFPSLNIAQAVQIVCYEIARQYLALEATGTEDAQPEAAVTAEQMEHFYEHFQQTLTDIGYLDPEKPRRLMRRIRRLFNRARPDSNEYNIRRGILTAARNAAVKHKS